MITWYVSSINVLDYYFIGSKQNKFDYNRRKLFCTKMSLVIVINFKKINDLNLYLPNH